MNRLGDEITILKGRKAPEVYTTSQENTQRYIQIDDLRTDSFLQYARDEQGVLANENDVLIAWDGANAGTIGFGLDGYIGSTIAILRFNSRNIFTPYLGYFLKSKFDYLQENATGATIPHVSRRSLEDLELEIPSLLEQKRLAAILAKADRLRRLRRYGLTVSDTYLQTVFLEMFGKEAAQKWPRVKVSDVAAQKKNAIRTGPFGSQLLH